ncbi:hypothetical protein JYU34_005536 [Plutella xylostella]|uniref:Uncharacterized protein n=1 Tax=Plutella xylostella TaxID=51655 RepID=A0ABQ7QTG3_PLUXY|nr:hypothetical protein JYU34_005536 [Plutella xylostella]
MKISTCPTLWRSSKSTASNSAKNSSSRPSGGSRRRRRRAGCARRRRPTPSSTTSRAPAWPRLRGSICMLDSNWSGWRRSASRCASWGTSCTRLMIG